MNAVTSTLPTLRAAAALLVGALVASLLAAAVAAPPAEASTFDFRLTPKIEQNTAVRWGQRVVVSGTAPSGTITDARLLALNASGAIDADQSIPGSVRNRQATAQQQGLLNSDGVLTGELSLDCTFGPPANQCSNEVRQVVLELTVGGVTARSAPLRVDYTNPIIRRYELTKPDEITVVFSEPVYHPQGEGFLNPLDWSIAGPAGQSVPPVSMSRPGGEDCVYEAGEDATAGPSGCTRVLKLALPMDEDATPQVRYLPALDRQQFVDFASNVVQVAAGGSQAHSEALDRIRPPSPRIDAVNGQAPDSHGRTTGETTSPTVTVSNLRDGHTVRFMVDGQQLSEHPAAGSSGTFQLPELPPADEHTIQAVVLDPSGNKSTDTDLHAARSDSGPSSVRYCIDEHCPLDLLPGVEVLQPPGELHTSERSHVISGVVDPALADVEVQLRDRLTGRSLASTLSGDGGAWSFPVELDLERRYRFEVVTRDGDRVNEARVPDIVLDSTQPLLQVLQPAPSPGGLLGGDTRERYRADEAVEVTWLASDPAPLALDLDTLPGLDSIDNGAHIDIDLVFGDGQRREVTRELDYTSLTQSFQYLVAAEDVVGAEREAVFEVTVTDMAGNTRTASSHPIVIDGTLSQLVNYQRWFVQNHADESIVQARFPVTLQGTTRASDWRIDGVPVRSATASTSGGGTVVALVASQAITDPNARPLVQFTPVSLDPTRLRGADGREIDGRNLAAQDKIPPVLSISAPDPGPRSAEAVTITGQTDQTEDQNTVRAYRDGRAIAQVTAGTNGQFALHVPLEPDRLNEVVVRAVDPSSNLSPDRPFEVIEDSTPPVVVIDQPAADSAVSRDLDIRWTTIDKNPDVVDIDYRVGSGPWQSLVVGGPDDGRHRWRIPQTIPDDAFLSLRVTATDKAGHRGHATVVRGFSPSLPVEAFVAEHCNPAPPAPFADRDRIPEVHRANVDCLYALGITRGVPRDGQLWFLPHDDISRAQFTGFVYRTVQLLGVELPGPATRFEDVPAGHTFDGDIHQLAAAAIVEGYDRGRFGPLDPIKRDQTASLLLRTWEYTREEALQAQGSGYFADTGDSFHRRNIDAAYEAGLVEGRVAPRAGEPGTYEPASPTSRAQMATVLMRYLRQVEA